MQTSTAVELPHFLQIEPVGQCNLRCRMCPVQFRPTGAPDHPPAFMEYDVFRRLVDQFPDLRELQLQGLGEPLLHPRFFDMVRYAAQRGVEVSTNTNMSLLTERRAEECVQSGLRRIHVSLDGASAETYEYIRVRSRFDLVLRNFRRLLDAKRRLGSVFPEIQIVMVIMRKNLQELPALVRLAHGLCVTSISVQHLCHEFTESKLPARYRSMRAFVDGETLQHEESALVERYFAQARAVADEKNITLRLPVIRSEPRPAPAPGHSRCNWPWNGAYVSYSGEAMPCCMVSTPDRINFGNMARNGVAPVWNNEAYTEFRAQLADDRPHEICRSCAIYTGTF